MSTQATLLNAWQSVRSSSDFTSRYAEGISPYHTYCDGFASPGAAGTKYFVGLALGVGKAPITLSHAGSSLLDSINAFDRAEVDDVYIGQINMITVSSFCGLNGTFWGYHVVRSRRGLEPHPDLPDAIVEYKQQRVPVYSAAPLIDATRALFGTVTNKRFPLLPGAHVPCAGKNITRAGPHHLYCGFAMGVPEYPDQNAHLLMEDFGTIPLGDSGTELVHHYRQTILTKLAQSVLAIGENQRVRYREVLVAMKDILIGQGEMGCALVAAPYFTLARGAVPHDGVDQLFDMTLEDWEHSIAHIVAEASRR